jgi:hypothetical protein
MMNPEIDGIRSRSGCGFTTLLFYKKELVVGSVADP